MKLTVLFVLMATPALAQNESSGIAMLGVRAHGVEKTLSQLLDEALLVTLKESGVFSSVMGSSDVAQMLDHEQQKTILGCKEDSCLAEVGGALGVPFLGSCTLGKLGDKYLVTLKVIASEEAKVISRGMKQVDDEGGLVEAVQSLVSEAAKEVKIAFPKKSAPPSVAQRATTTKKKTWLPTVSLVVAGVGAVSAGSGLVMQISAQHTFDEAKSNGITAANVEAIEGDFRRAHQLIGGGAGLLALGVIGLFL